MRLLPLKMPPRAIGVLCSTLVVPDDVGLYAQSSLQRLSAEGETAPFTPAELEGLVAPIVLCPDPLVAQVLAAATYPLGTVEARSWLKENSGLESQDPVQAAAKTGAISGPNGAAAGIRTPGAAAGAISGPNGAAAEIRTPRGSAGAVTAAAKAIHLFNPDQLWKAAQKN